MWRIDIHQMLRFIHEYHFHTQQRKRVLDRFSHLQPLCGITTLSLWVGKQRQILPPISHGHMPLELFENLAKVTRRAEVPTSSGLARMTTTGTTDGSGSSARSFSATRCMTVDFPTPVAPKTAKIVYLLRPEMRCIKS